jgi:hypothetical protein
MSFARPLYLKNAIGGGGATGDSYWQAIVPTGIYYDGGPVAIGQTGALSTLDVSGNLRTTEDALINTLTVGHGGGNISTNTALGSSALAQNTTGSNNTAIGQQALISNMGGNENTAVGTSALTLNTSGLNNTAIGPSALYFNITGSNNTGIGSSALLNTIGSQNTALGCNAGTDLSGNSINNTFLGYNTDVDISSNIYNNSTALGYNATIDASNQIVLGTSNEKVKIPGSYVGIGGVYNPSSGYVLDVSGNMRTTMDASINSITVGLGGGNISTNTALGVSALQANNTGLGDNTAIGKSALSSNTTGVQNVAVGSSSLLVNSSGNSNIAIGVLALQLNNGSSNIAIGFDSLYNNLTGGNNTAVGLQALFYNETGSLNVALGNNAGFDLSGNSNYNTFLGYYTDVSSNLLIYTNSTALGYQAIIDASNQIVLGGQDPANSVPYPSVKIPGSYVGIGGVYNPSSGYVLEVDGSANFIGTVNAASYNTSSDYRIKENITQLDSTFIVDNLNPVTYLNNKLGKQDIGLIAHELQEIYPELVHGMKDGEQLQSVNYIGLIPILIKEVKMLKERVKILEEISNNL